ncbi:MAG TPA: BadF/BadG/BcrA/BcrD ATPase family protein [Gemmatimonadaceae bacterium]|nr:BadF/BadG/BcrA/BcrD ATPase family protein [Gemmatimonadaceae bacterium]
MKTNFIGVDGGGSNTRVLVADEQGRELSSASGGPSAVRPGAASQSASVITQVVREALAALDSGQISARMLVVGVAGVGREEERAALTAALERSDLAEEVIVCPDATIALEDAFGDGAGILVVSGTGSVAFGRGPTGTVERCGGWGPNCGDEGSGAWIGRRALSIVTAAADGREPETSLGSAILGALQLRETTELIPWSSQAIAADFASLAPVVMEAAATGDLRANSLVSLAAEELMLHVRALGRRLFGDERATIPLAMSGGLLSKGSLLRKRLEHRLKTAVPGGTVRSEEILPVRGAVRLALRSAAAQTR